MVNKNIIREMFMKLESYDRINVISDILKISNLLELEFYSSVIESILQYQKLSFNSSREEANDDHNLERLITSNCMESDVRSKLIFTLSLLKTSNISGAKHIFDFLKQNLIKFKEQAYNNPDAFEEIMLIYQLANDHPAFSFDHCQEIYDYVTQIRSLSVTREYVPSNSNYELINDLSLLSMNVSDNGEYVYNIKVQWEHCECCITRTLEEMFQFYRRLCTMFPEETKSGEICKFLISFLPDNRDLSFDLMSTFLKDFLNSPPLIVRCDFVRQFFRPKQTDKHICSCDYCPIASNEFQRQEKRSFDTVAKGNNSIDVSDNDEYTMWSENKTDTSCSSNFNLSIDSRSPNNNLPITNRTEYCSQSPIKTRRKKTMIYSTGSSPINTPSDDSEIYFRSESLKNNSNRFSRQLSMVIENVNKSTSCKDTRTENWLSQSNQTITDNQSDESMESDSKFEDNCSGHLQIAQSESGDHPNLTFDISSIAQCRIGNLYDWLRDIELERYYLNLCSIKFENFYLLTEKRLTELGLDLESSRTIVASIAGIKRSDIVQGNQGTVNIIRRETLNLMCTSPINDSSRNRFPKDVSRLNNFGLQNQEPGGMIFTNLAYRYWIPNNCVIFAPNTVQNVLINLPMRSELNHRVNKQSDQQ